MARIYTKAGDAGETSLADGTRTIKSAARVDLYGDVDELNSVLGYCVARMRTAVADAAVSGASSVAALSVLADEMEAVQHRLFDLGGLLADPGRCAALSVPGQPTPAFPTTDLESSIDRQTAELPELRRFILPGGSETGALTHIARAVCRRCERKAVALAAVEPVPASVLAYLNRLSDFLFTFARSTNAANDTAEVAWRPATESRPDTEDS